MDRARRHCRFVCRLALAVVCIALITRPSARGQIRPLAAPLAGASADLIDRLRADAFTYFRFVNRPWTALVCEAFADLPDLPIVRLHGDAHVEQFALTNDAWGLDDFDDSARGPEFVDIVRYLGSIDLATRQRGWTHDRDAVWNRFFAGYRAGLSNPNDRPRQPDIVRLLRKEAPVTRAAFLAWGEQQMQPMDQTMSMALAAGMEAFEGFVRRERPNLAPGYFMVKRAGWLHMGIGSALTRKVLIRVQGATADDDDDQLLEAKEVTNLDGVSCLEGPTTPPALRIVDGARQLSRLKHDILAVGPTMLISGAGTRAKPWLDWWISSWEPSYREVRVSDLRSVRDLEEIAYDSGVQLGAGETTDVSVRKTALMWAVKLEGRFRKETSTIVGELLAGWRELAQRNSQ